MIRGSHITAGVVAIALLNGCEPRWTGGGAGSCGSSSRPCTDVGYDTPDAAYVSAPPAPGYAPSTALPHSGSDTRTVLAELGYDDRAIDALVASGAVSVEAAPPG